MKKPTKTPRALNRYERALQALLETMTGHPVRFTPNRRAVQILLASKG